MRPPVPANAFACQLRTTAGEIAIKRQIEQVGHVQTHVPRAGFGPPLPHIGTVPQIRLRVFAERLTTGLLIQPHHG